jgi:opacity protein-like surface antigen
MKILVTSITLVILSCSSFAALASKPDISWNYVSAGYAKANIKNDINNTIKPDGYQINGSYLLSDTLYVAASYTDLSGDIVFDDFSVRLGMRQAAAENLDAFFEGGYEQTKNKINGFESVTSNGFQAGAGFRYRATPMLELAAAVRYSNGSDSSSATYGDLSARVKLTPVFDLYAGYQFDSDVSLLATGLVLNF